MSLSLADLKKLHEKGLALIYLRPKSKRPFENKWTTQSPKTWDELEASFEKTYNVGVRLGEPSKLPSGKYLCAIDCDVKSKSRRAIKEMNAKLSELGIDLSVAPTVMSGRGNGSKHIYVQTVKPACPMKFAQSEIKVKVLMPGETRPHSKLEMKRLTEAERAQGMRIRPAWEIAFMGTGQQTVLPPSIHPDTGFKYAWASPLTVKHAPVFTPPVVSSTRVNDSKSKDKSCLSFKAVDVDLWSSKLPVPMIHTIQDGRGCEDRSASLMTIAMTMCRHGFTDNEILSVLSNPDHWISGAAYDRRKNRQSAVEWLHQHTLLKARFETSPMRYFDNPPTREERKPLPKEEAKKLSDNIKKDKERLFDLTKARTPKVTLKNVVCVLEHKLKGKLVALNEFSNRTFFLKDTPYGGQAGKELADHHDISLKHYIACEYDFEPAISTCLEAHTIAARKNLFHPVREYLQSLEWDEKPRLDAWLKKAFGVRGPDAYIKAISRKTLVAAVKRVFEPGCKFDHVLVLEGNQGVGKSRGLSILASPAWFTDSLGDIHNKDVVDQMTGKWVIELSELASIRGRESEHVKSFLSRQVDRVRMSYGRRSEDYPRQSIFVGSTNASEYFSDETGNRRFWPARVGEADLEWLRLNRDQLWAEAVMRYELGEDLYLSKDVEAVAREEQEKRYEVDEWEIEIKKIMEKEGGPYVTTELWRSVNLDKGTGHPDDYSSKRIGKIMRRLGYIRTVRRFDGVLGKCWIKR